jgi:hypothetical protein
MPHLAYIERVYVEVIPDEDPDLSYLEQDYAEVSDDAEREGYLTQDYMRIHAYHRDEWSMVGVRLVADVTTDREGYVDRPIELRSAGVWGIESDSGKGYALQTGREQQDDLREQLEALRFSKEEIDHCFSGDFELVDSVGMTEPRPEISNLAADTTVADPSQQPSPELN